MKDAVKQLQLPLGLAVVLFFLLFLYFYHQFYFSQYNEGIRFSELDGGDRTPSVTVLTVKIHKAKISDQ